MLYFQFRRAFVGQYAYLRVLFGRAMLVILVPTLPRFVASLPFRVFG